MADGVRDRSHVSGELEHGALSKAGGGIAEGSVLEHWSGDLDSVNLARFSDIPTDVRLRVNAGSATVHKPELPDSHCHEKTLKACVTHPDKGVTSHQQERYDSVNR